MRIAILDDYQNVALEMADWSPLAGRAEISVFTDTLTDLDALADRLAPFDIVCVMRERTPLPGILLERLPNLKLIASTAPRNASIDVAKAGERGIQVVHTGYSSAPTIELTWALILASSRYLVEEVMSLRQGGWQTRVGDGLRGKTLGILGLGNIGTEVAAIGRAFGMTILAWSPNLTTERAREAGAELTDKSGLFSQSDIITIHMVLSPKTRGIVDAVAIGQMKPTARLINMSRGPLVDETALTDALRSDRIAGAAVDVYDVEPLPSDDPLRSMRNMLATPHIGYVSKDLYRIFYGDTVRNIVGWLDARNAG